ncbi:hypothetical protein TESG_08574 [Trichophyton tonsurans CBS 112818]|uniref:Uncharacterized protein n=1 Tax=Trichophyton tonsurans (strain CBS 112818) TaxID=647933 RepID=F2S604_TRIT1|nr:hypothetical protein TESG_08574 [Trichophyton tonsurans CBS 112818]
MKKVLAIVIKPAPCKIAGHGCLKAQTRQKKAQRVTVLSLCYGRRLTTRGSSWQVGSAVGSNSLVAGEACLNGAKGNWSAHKLTPMVTEKQRVHFGFLTDLTALSDTHGPAPEPTAFSCAYFNSTSLDQLLCTWLGIFPTLGEQEFLVSKSTEYGVPESDVPLHSGQGNCSSNRQRFEQRLLN